MDHERLEKLSQLRASGALSEEEFQQQKEQLLSSGHVDESQNGEPLSSDANLGTYFEEGEISSGRKSLFSTIGLVLFFLGLAIVFYAGWIYDPSVSSSPDIGGSTIQEVLDSYERAKATADTRVNNTGLLNRQLVIALLGVALMICGGVMYAVSKVIDAIDRR